MDKQYYKIGEVSKILGEDKSTLRFWEKEFRQLKPVRSPTNQRYYTQRHIELLKRIKNMVRDEMYTLDGVKEKLRNHEPNTENDAITSQATFDTKTLKKELLEILELLK